MVQGVRKKNLPKRLNDLSTNKKTEVLPKRHTEKNNIVGPDL